MISAKWDSKALSSPNADQISFIKIYNNQKVVQGRKILGPL